MSEYKINFYYDPDGDCIECLWSSDPYYAEWHGPVDIYRSEETNEVVGVLLKNFSQKLNNPTPKGE